MQKDTLTLRQLNRATLARQLLLAREHVGVVEAVERLGGMQAQEAKPPFIGLWTRVAGFSRNDLHAAVHSREVVRATSMRGTLHLMSAADYAAMRASFQPMLTLGMRALGTRAEGLDLKKVLRAARTLLADQPRTFNELRPLLVERFPKVNDRALGYAVRLHLPLIMVPTKDRWAYPGVADFTLAEEWLGHPLSTNDSPPGLVLRYLAAFGPASAADVQAWSGLQGLKEVLEELRPTLRTFRNARGRELFDLPDAPRPDPDVVAPVRFLPEFDNLVLAHSDRTRVVADEHKTAVVTKNLRVRATFLLDGFVAGTWEVQRKRNVATLRLTPFEALPTTAAAELAEEGEALLRFVEEDATEYEVDI